MIAHPPAVVLVEGEAGIGKTRLVREALAHPRMRHRAVLAGSCRPNREPFPYGPIVDLLRGLDVKLADLTPATGALRPYLPELTGSLPPLPETPPGPAAERHCVFRAVRELLDAAGAAVLVIEDLHWADDGTRDLVRFIIDDPPRGLATVLTYRQSDVPGNGLVLGRAVRRPAGVTSVSLRLPPLDVEAVRTLTGSVLGGSEIPIELAKDLHRRTSGIPFVLTELLRARQAYRPLGSHSGPDEITDDDALDAAGVPPLLWEAMTERMATMSPAATDAVHAVAVLRTPSTEDMVGAVAQLDVGDGCAGLAIREALAAGVLHEVEEGKYGFRHELDQRAVYESLPGPLRRELHGRAVQSLAQHEPLPLAQLTHHARHAGNVADWLRYAEAGAEEAAAAGDIALVVELVDSVLSSSDVPQTERARLAVRLSRVAVIGITDRRVERMLRRIIRDNRLPDAVRGEIRLNIGLLLFNQAGDYQQGRTDAELAVDELRTRPALAARGMAALAIPSWGDAPLADHERWLARAQELVAGQDDAALRMAVHGNHLTLRMAIGDPTVWQDLGTLSRHGQSLDVRRQVARTYGNLSEATTWLGHYEAAQRFGSKTQQLAAECGAPYVSSSAHGTILRLDWVTGRWSGLYDRARHTLDMTPLPSAVAADAHLVLGLLAVAKGEWEEAAERLDAAGLADPGNAATPGLAMASGAKARLLAAQGRLDEARAEVDRAARLLRRKQVWVWAADKAPALVTVWIRAGCTEDARRFVADFEAGTSGRDAPLAVAALHSCHGILAGAANHESAIEAFEQARGAYAALPRPYSAARVSEAAARCRLKAGDSSASAELVALVEEFTAIGATRDAARCRRVLRTAGVIIPSPQGRRGYGDELSPREKEVARLVALDHTNREIADILFLSHRTVEQHVANVLRKLGVTSRTKVASGLRDTSASVQ